MPEYSQEYIQFFSSRIFLNIFSSNTILRDSPKSISPLNRFAMERPCGCVGRYCYIFIFRIWLQFCKNVARSFPGYWPGAFQRFCKEMPRNSPRYIQKLSQDIRKRYSEELLPDIAKTISEAFPIHCYDVARMFPEDFPGHCQDMPRRFSQDIFRIFQEALPEYCQSIPKSIASNIGLMRWADALGWRAGLTLWTKTLDWCAGLTRWADALDWRTGLTLWTKTLDWCAGLTRCGADLVFLLFYRREVSKACVLKGPCIKQCRNAPDPVFLLFYILAL